MVELQNRSRLDMESRANDFLVNNQAVQAHGDGIFNALVEAMQNVI